MQEARVKCGRCQARSTTDCVMVEKNVQLKCTEDRHRSPSTQAFGERRGLKLGMWSYTRNGRGLLQGAVISHGVQQGCILVECTVLVYRGLGVSSIGGGRNPPAMVEDFQMH